MDKADVMELFAQLQSGVITTEEAYERIKFMPYQDIGFAKIDHHRSVREDFPEVVFCPGKTLEQIAGILANLTQFNHNIIATKGNADIFAYLQNIFADVKFSPVSGIIYFRRNTVCRLGPALVISAGTADIPVAEEAALCLEIMGVQVERVYDVGVAGLHRLISVMPLIDKAQAVIVAAGMEGALASVVGGMTSRPVVAVPTSIGYGASFNGLAALLSMLNSCASGVGVVNIDNGYGAAALVFSILSLANG